MHTALTLRPSLYEETVPGGGHTSFILKRGQLLRITDIEGGANVSLLLFNAGEKSERLNLPDTLKGQHTAKLTLEERTARHCRRFDPACDHLLKLDRKTLKLQLRKKKAALKESRGDLARLQASAVDLE